MRKLFKERKLFKGGNYMRKYGIWDAGPERVMLKTQIDNAGLERVMHKTQ